MTTQTTKAGILYVKLECIKARVLLINVVLIFICVFLKGVIHTLCFVACKSLFGHGCGSTFIYFIYYFYSLDDTPVHTRSRRRLNFGESQRFKGKTFFLDLSGYPRAKEIEKELISRGAVSLSLMRD